MVLPFGALLAAIALGPLLFARWWGRHYPKLAVGLGLITLGYYFLVLPHAARHTVLETAEEYVSFIALIGSLFVVSGGIHITVKGEATPRVNVMFLFVGAVVANLLGTTGASMLLIRPWLRMNKYRLTAHHVVFFIFVVSNVGGCLTPIGDPPLFLGYLNAVPFWWITTRAWPAWLVGVGLLLAMFYAVDRRNYTRAPKRVREVMAEPADQWRFEGLANLGFLAVILGSVFIHRPLFLREGLMMGAAVASYFTTRPQVHQANEFNFHPIREVAVLFAGIFATMMPALDWLQTHAGSLGAPTPGLFFWGTGLLSSVLDNAPTYLSYLSATVGSFVRPDAVTALQQHVQQHGADLTGLGLAGGSSVAEVLRHYHAGDLAARRLSPEVAKAALLLADPTASRVLLAVSIGAVFFGANTYIGNGPNFMVKSIADHQKAHTPTFLGYVFKFTLPYMVPMLAVVWWLFFRR